MPDLRCQPEPIGEVYTKSVEIITRKLLIYKKRLYKARMANKTSIENLNFLKLFEKFTRYTE